MALPFLGTCLSTQVAISSSSLSTTITFDTLGKLPLLQCKNLSLIRDNHLYATTCRLISIIGFLDSIVSAKQNAARYSYSISPNRELVALGAANLAGAFVPGTLPAYGSITRSRINGEAGARTQMASLICAAIILVATFFLLPWLYYLPKCVLGSM